MKSVEIVTDFILNALLKGIWFQLFNLIKILDELCVLHIDLSLNFLSRCHQKARAFQSFFKYAFVAAIYIRVGQVNSDSDFSRMYLAQFILLIFCYPVHAVKSTVHANCIEACQRAALRWAHRRNFRLVSTTQVQTSTIHDIGSLLAHATIEAELGNNCGGFYVGLGHLIWAYI